MINAEPLHFTFSPRFHLPHSIRKPLCYTKLSPSLTFLKRYSLSISPHLKPHKNPNSKVIRTTSSHLGGVKIDEFSEGEESDLPVELNYTRSLPPALTLEHGFFKIKEAVEKLKSNPPSSASGIVRFQVPVPPSAKAFSWLCSQPRSLEVFPQFYLSKENPKKSTLDSHSLAVPGVSGVGAAVYLMGSLSSLRGQNLMKRYLSVDSPLIRAYGFVGIKFDTDSCSIKHESDSFYVCIPHIELGDYEGITLLAATLAWNGSSLCSLDGAFHSLELSLNQAMFGSSGEVYDNKCIYNILGKTNVVEDDNIQMVSASASSFDGKHCGAFHLQLEEVSASSQFCFRLSSSIALTRNMLDHPSEGSLVLQHSANMNAVWASLIIEECVRHGLKYFCIAPGSRSSPLAVAASSHRYTLCVSCFDERSLAFHALGYARGSSRPAVVITSSGTAVSNLLPAVVEASQDFVPILLLTADRPPELQDTGANQAINQVNHFGSFVRYFFNLPPPTDHVPARMVLTTVDSAVYCATHDPCGPVHINCQFREPLEDTPRDWMPSCLKGLDFWMSSTEPFSKYIRMQHPHSTNSIDDRLDEVLKLIQCASKGLLVLGAIHTEHEMWAALLLAKHLSWPTVTDILSGLRLRTVFTTFSEIKENFLFLDHLDHALLSDAVREWAQADVIVQVGTRITSKRIGQMLEMCSPCTYIMVDKHPYRHDPSHIVTHRIQSTITEFASSVLQLQFPRISSKWSRYLQAINMMVAWEIEFQVHSEQSLTEPYVTRVVSEALPSNAALFIGNSMVIRDADMYGRGWLDSQTRVASIMSSCEMEFLGLRVTGNRGASGIDGLLSTAIGFSAGCNKQVFCVIGDISFLHDTNALVILKQRSWRKPMTILVINNHGGAIFSLLPIAERTQTSILNQYFYTSHNISIGKLCEAHSINHLQVRTKLELKRALSISQEADADLIIEVESCIEDNANFHSILRQASLRVADHTLSILSRVLVPDHKSNDLLFCTIQKVEYSLYRIQLSAPPTSTPRSVVSSNFYRQGFVLTMYLEDGTVGYGEVAPLEMHAEYLEEVEEQLRFVAHVIEGTKLSYVLPLLRGSFCSWISGYLGIPPQSLFPSVRCGIEMAVLNALAARQRCTLANLLIHHACTTNHTELLEENETIHGSSVQVCALLDSNGTPREVADVAVKLAEEGFTTIKLKVGRRESPSEDAAVIQEIRKRVGPKIRLRADANRNWTFEQASQFGRSVKFCDLQYIEEPVDIEDDIIKFCEETGLPVALDETIDNIQGDPLFRLEKFVHPGIVAVVIKPSVVGGFENAALIGNWAHKQDKMAVISAAFESSLSLSTYIQFSYYLNQQNVDICKLKNKELKEPVAHGLGTYRWLKEDVTTESVRICVQPYREIAESSPEDAARLLQNLKIDQNVIQRSYTGQQVREYQLRVDYQDLSYSIKVLEAGPRIDNDVLVFLHGFLGTGQDWIPVMKALSASMQCISVDLPGHGETLMQRHGNQDLRHEPSMSLETISNVLCKLISTITPSRVVLVGYSMGARIALYMALRCHDQIDGAVIISGSPGLNDIKARQSRMVLDDARAHSLTVNGLPFFLDWWYSGDLWTSLRARPDFEKIISSRVQHNNVHGLAKALADLSIGRQPSLWEELKQCEKPMLFLFGEKDKKFKAIGQQIRYELNHSGCEDDRRKIHKVMEVPDSGHAIHLENPLLVISAVRKFLRGLKERKT